VGAHRIAIRWATSEHGGVTCRELRSHTQHFLFVEFSHPLCVRGLIWILVVSLLCDMGIPQEGRHRACAAYAIYLR
jgi:hypothetical protein